MSYGSVICILRGRIGEDIVLRKNADDKPYCYFEVAVNRREYTDKSGNRIQPKPDWYKCCANGVTAEIIAKNAKKGHEIYLETIPRETESEYDKNGTHHVVRETVYNVIPSRFDISYPAKTEKAESTEAQDASRPTSAPPAEKKQAAPTPAPTAPVQNAQKDADDDVLDADEFIGVVGKLPF